MPAGHRQPQPPAVPALPLPSNAGEYPALVGRALAALRLAGVGGPYALVLGAVPYTAMSEAAVYGNPVRDHVDQILDGEIVAAPAIDGGFLLSARGGDFDLRLGQDLSVGYLSHDATTVQLYFQETLTFLAYTSEAVVPLVAG